MANVYERKLRGLFIIDADHLFTDTHPLWKTIAAFRSSVVEIHVAVFSKQKVREIEKFIEHDNQLLIYHFHRGNFLFRFRRSIASLEFHLLWHKEFRPDFVVSFSETEGALAGLKLSRRYEKKFFQHTTAHSIDNRGFSFHALLTKYVLRHATMLFVPGPETAQHLASAFRLPPATFLPVEPPIAIKELTSETNKHDFHTEHPQYNFFVSTVLYGSIIPAATLGLYKKVALKYPRTALVIFVEESLVAHFEHLVKRNHWYGVLVYPKNDALLSSIAGTHAYLALTREEDIDVHLLAALSVQVPVVALSYGIAKELFVGSRYEAFLIPEGSTEKAVVATISLIEDQRLRAEYALNTKTLFSKLSFNTTEQYAQKMYNLIAEIVRPELPVIEG